MHIKFTCMNKERTNIVTFFRQCSIDLYIRSILVHAMQSWSFTG